MFSRFGENTVPSSMTMSAVVSGSNVQALTAEEAARTVKTADCHDRQRPDQLTLGLGDRHADQDREHHPADEATVFVRGHKIASTSGCRIDVLSA